MTNEELLEDLRYARHCVKALSECLIELSMAFERESKTMKAVISRHNEIMQERYGDLK